MYKVPCRLIVGIFALWIGHFCSALAETRDYGIEVTAQIQKAPAQITLNWRASGDVPGFIVSRKTKEATTWQDLATLGPDARSFVDSTVQVRQAFEYRVIKNPLPYWGGSGYIYAGIEAPMIDQRGKLILLVDSSFSQALQSELSRLQQDLVGDGWIVLRHDVGRDQSAQEIKAIIKADYQNDPANTKSVFLFGHVPVPYSGDLHPDGHDNHIGAWAADGYYGDMDGAWSDSSVNDTSAAREQNHNVPGDGKFDQSTFPSALELQVGRVDLANLPGFAPLTELDLLRQYLNKDHNFRNGLLKVDRHGFINDNFGENGGEAFASSGWRNFAPFFGSDNLKSTPGWTYYDVLRSESYLWSYACGGGSYNSCYYVGGTGDYHATDTKSVFYMLLGSYFGDWDAENDFLRGPLGSATYGLVSIWAGRPHWFVHHMALGETIGYSTRTTQNNTGNGPYHPAQHAQEVHIALMGDPTLRMHPVAPVSNLSASVAGVGVLVRWSPSTDNAIVGYHVYRAANENGPFTRLTANPVAVSAYTDLGASGGTYMVRAVKLESSPSGTYFNPSQGIFAKADSSTILPGDPVVLTMKGGPNGLELSFPSQIGKSYTVEGSSDLKNWTSVQTVIATSLQTTLTSDSKSGALFYRVR
jgi:hypothetical protein